MSLSDERNDNDESSEIPNEDAAADQTDAASDPESEQFGAVDDTAGGAAAGDEMAATADDFDASADEPFDVPDADALGSSAAQFEGDFVAADTDAFPGTMPLFDSSGNLPADVDAIWEAVSRWEAAAAAAPDDPRFVKRPTAKPRNDLAMIDRGPSQPLVWIDRATMTPVLYSGEPEELQTADDLPTSAFNGAQRNESGEQDLNVGMSRPVLLVTVDRAGQHFQKAFEARGERWLSLMQKIAQERIDYEKWWQAGEDRANGGDY